MLKIKAYDNFLKQEIKNIRSIHFDRFNENKICLIVYTQHKINPCVEIKERDKIYCNEFTIEEVSNE